MQESEYAQAVALLGTQLPGHWQAISEGLLGSYAVSTTTSTLIPSQVASDQIKIAIVIELNSPVPAERISH